MKVLNQHSGESNLHKVILLVSEKKDLEPKGA
jgi:hypothetical protein